MKTIIRIICLFLSLQSFGQSEILVGVDDDIIDTVSLDKEHYIRFYRKDIIQTVDLDFDNYMDTIKWYRYMEQSIERRYAFYEQQMKIEVKNKQGTLTYKGDWEFIKEELKGYPISEHKIENLPLLLKLDKRTTAIILAHQLYASDIEAYTIIKIDSLSKPQVVFDSELILTTIKDIDYDGFVELIGRHPNYGVAEYALCYVPFMVFKYSDSLYMDKKLTFDYNLPQKSYREFPESSISILTEDELKQLTKDKLRLMRNEIFADYGFVFASADLNAYFTKKSWYKPRPNGYFILTDWEKKNIETIKRVERQLEP